MFEHILIPLDGSTIAECVLPHAVAVARAFDSNLTLVRVLEPAPVASPGMPVDPLSWRITQVEAETYMDQVAQRLRSAGLQTQFFVLDGSAAQRVVEFAFSSNTSLIILSSHGQSGLTRWNISSSTRKIIQNSHRSTMVIRAYQTPPRLEDFNYKRILIPLDGSVRAELVLPVARRLAQFHKAELLLSHIVYKPEMPRRSPLTEEDSQLVDHFIERNRDEAKKYMEQIEAGLDVDHTAHLVVGDNVEDSLHSLAEGENVDLIIMSAHGYSGSRRQPFGTVTTNFIEYGQSHLLIIQDLPANEVQPSQAELAAQEFKGR